MKKINASIANKKAASLFAGLCCIIISSSAHADHVNLVLDEVTFPVVATQWVTTKTALLTVNVNATLTDASLVATRELIMSQLGKIAQGEWHITQFERSQDSSGLEKLTVDAQVRVDQASLTNVYAQVKALTKPGLTYSVGSIEFTPSRSETEAARAALRAQLYQQVADEVVRLNKTYPEQHYSVHSVAIDGMMSPPMPAAQMMRGITNNLVTMAAPGIIVSNELVMSAVVSLASNRTVNSPSVVGTKALS